MFAIALVRAAVWRHWGKMLALWLAIVATVVTVTAISDPEYRSETKLFVRIGRENATLDPTATIGQGTVVALPSSREHELNSVVEVIKSRAMAEHVVDELGPDYFFDKPATTSGAPAPQPVAQSSTTATIWQRINPLEATSRRDKAIKKLSQNLGASVGKKSNIITLTFESGSAVKSQMVLTTLLDAYLKEHVRLNRTPGAHEFVASQAELLSKELAAAEEALRTFKNESGIASLSDQRMLLEQRQSTLHSDMLVVRRELASVGEEIDRIESQMKDIPAVEVTSKIDGVANQSADFMRQQLYDLELKEQELVSKFTDEHFQVKQLREQVAEARKILEKVERDRSQTTTAANPVYEQLRQKLAAAEVQEGALKAKEERLTQQLAASSQEMTRLNDRALEINRLEREVAIRETNHRRYVDNLEQTRLDEALHAERMTNVAIAQPPSLEARAVRPRKLFNYAVGIALATMASFAIGILLELPRQPLPTSEVTHERRLPMTITQVPAQEPVPRYPR